MLYLYDAIDCVRSKAHLLGMNTATTANETAKALQTALDAALMDVAAYAHEQILKSLKG